MSRGAHLPAGQLRRRRDRLVDYLDAWGDLHVSDDGAATGRRRLEFYVESPGDDLPIDVKLRYREYYQQDAAGDWRLAKYTYEYLDIAGRMRLAFHLHDIELRSMVAHAHCESSDGLSDGVETHHLRAIEYDLREAHEAFMELYARGATVDCSAYLPLEVDRGE